MPQPTMIQEQQIIVLVDETDNNIVKDDKKHYVESEIYGNLIIK